MIYFRVRVLMLVFGVLWIAEANADPYTFYRYESSGVPVGAQHSESPYEACEAAGAAYKAAGTLDVVGASFAPAGSVCSVLYDNSTGEVLTLFTGAGSCAGDIEYDFLRQQCVDSVNPKQSHALSLAGFLWFTFVGGMLVGFKAGG